MKFSGLVLEIDLIDIMPVMSNISEDILPSSSSLAVHKDLHV